MHPQKGQLYLYWGYNHAEFTHSDIHFTGRDYDFTLQNVAAKDRPTKFDMETYFGLASFTIPQYNFRIGYFITEHWSLSFGADHMKYVVQRPQQVRIDGYIQNSGTPYDGVYEQNEVIIEDGFLEFEHTDGLNYLNLAARYHRPFFTYHFLTLSALGGGEMGMLVPRSNVTLLNNERYDEFHIAGYGLSGMLGLNLELFHYFFLQAELKGGFIHMPNIRTTPSKEDNASQHFFFYQPNVVFGFNIPLLQKKSKGYNP